MNNKPLNKLQIETASEVLNNALKNKKEQIREAAFQKDIIKYKPLMANFNKLAVNLKKEILRIKTIVEKNPKLKVDLDAYNSLANKLPDTIDNSNNENLIEVKETRYKYNENNSSTEYIGYEPDMSKEENEVKQFILGLKLGTALMTDLQPLLDKINKRNK